MIKKIVSGCLIGLSILMFLLAFYIIIFGTIAKNNNRLLFVFGYSYAGVPTDSMVGTYPDSFDPGSIVIIKNKPFEELKHLDVVVFKNEDDTRLIVHRLYIEDNGFMYTKGDKVGASIDGELLEENYQGTLNHIIKPSALNEMFSGSQSAILMGMSMILLVFVFYNIYQVMHIVYLKKKKKQEDTFDKDAYLESVRKEFYESLKEKKK